MAKKRTKDEAQAPANEPTTTEAAAPETAPAAEATATSVPVAAPDKAGPAYTVDNRVGYRKEANADGDVQIRFAKRPDGSRPDDELLAPVRGQQPDVGWDNREKAWRARTPKGVEILDEADDQLADIGRRRRDSSQSR
jgi:hypothetical protein